MGISRSRPQPPLPGGGRTEGTLLAIAYCLLPNASMKEHTVTVRVRYGETDQMGVVYHPNYFLYFETGRTELMRASGVAYCELEKSGIFLVVTQASCRYRAAARYDQELRIVTRVDEVRKATVTFSYR